MNTHFNLETYQTVQIHSPSWFIQKLGIKRVKQTNGSKCLYSGSLCLIHTRRYSPVLSVVKREYVNQFFMVNPMDCLRVIFAANFYGRMSKGVSFNG